MNLQIYLPAEIVFNDEVERIIAEGISGSFGLLPNHIDFVEPLARGILTIRISESREVFYAVNEGLLVKQGDTVLISTPEAVRSDDLDHLKHTMEEEFARTSEHEREARSAMARLESDFIRRFIEHGG